MKASFEPIREAMDFPTFRSEVCAVMLISIIINGIIHSEGIRVEKVVVPTFAVAGKSVELQCHYREDADELYSLKWWRGEDHFYQYIHPSRSFYPTAGVRVDMNATLFANRRSHGGLEKVILENVGLDSAGVYKCEVMADKIFQTVYKEANMTVIFPPSGPPTIYGSGTEEKSVRAGETISLKCSVPPAAPAPIILWLINSQYAEKRWVSYPSTAYVEGLAHVSSNLNFEVTPELFDSSYNGIIIQCEARQRESFYKQTDTIIRYPERTNFFWFLGSNDGSCKLPSRPLCFLPWLSFSLANWRF